MNDIKNIMVIRPNHVSFTITDINEWIDIFTNGFGFQLASPASPRDPKAIALVTGVTGAEVLVAFIDAPKLRIELVQYISPLEKKCSDLAPCDSGFSHLALDVLDFEDAVQIASSYGLRAVGGTHVIDTGPNKGRRVIYLQHKDGVTIELIENVE